MMEEVFILLFVVAVITGIVIENKASHYYIGRPIHRWMHVYVFFPENFKPEGKRFHKYLVIHVIGVVILIIIWGIYASYFSST